MASAVVDTIGVTGAVLTTLCWVPQAVKIARERETRAISLPATTLSACGYAGTLLATGRISPT